MPLHLLASCGQLASVVHVQVFVPLVQEPAAQTSPTVHGLPSSQVAVLLVCVQPEPGVQASVVHGLPSSQYVATLTADPLHAPAAQTSGVVQALLSLHGSALLANTQPVVVEHESLVHTLLSLHVMAAPLQTPAAHTSPLVHALASSHALVLFVCWQPLATRQASLVHALPSLQITATLIGVPTQLPPVQVSAVVHALPSLQPNVLAV